MENNDRDLNLIDLPLDDNSANEIENTLSNKSDIKNPSSNHTSLTQTNEEVALSNSSISILKNKLFTKWDILVYVGVFLLLISLFFIFIFPTFFESQNHNGFKVYKNDRLVLEFNVNDKNFFIVDQNFSSLVEIKGNDKNKHCFNVVIYTSSEKKGFNEIVFDCVNLTAKVIESTCSSSKDCVHTPALTTNGSIYCAPHNLKIVPSNFDGLVPPIAG